MKPAYLRCFCDLYWSQQLLAPGDGESLCDSPEAFGNPYNNPQWERGGNRGVGVSMIPGKGFEMGRPLFEFWPSHEFGKE